MNPAAEIIYYYLLLYTLGCASLAFMYHLVLYIQRKERLLLYYWVYLFLLSLFLLSRVLLSKDQSGHAHSTWLFQFWDELLQLLFYYGYIEFVGRALDIRPYSHRKLYFFWKTLSTIILLIAVCHVVLMLTHTIEIRNRYLFRGSRLLLIVISLVVLLTYAFKKTTVFQQYILAGSLIFLVTGALAFASYVYHFSIGNIYALGFTFIGEIADVLLFSAAMGYRLRLTYEEKELALRSLEEQRSLNQQKDIENLKAIMETRYKERNRIARELHDDIGSSLSSINIFSTVADQYLQQDHTKAGELVNKIKLTSGKVMENMSDLVWAINAETDDTQSLVVRIRQFASSLLEAKNIRLEIETDEQTQQLLLKADAKKNILLVCKEAVNNIAKYSQASTAIIQVQVKEGQLYLHISDNGAGFTAGTTKGNGLLNMKNRCEESGGGFTVNSSAEKGTSITCTFPLTIISN
jgi:signal transduction histidine kinase